MSDTAQGGHGGDIYRMARVLGVEVSELVDLSTNGNVLCTGLTAQHVATEPYPFEHYPDLETSMLREAAARHEGLPADHILPGNGSAELIWLALTTLRPGHVLLLGPLFAEYERACAALGIAHEVLVPTAENGFLPDSADLARIAASTADMVIFCTPNNPTGTVYAPVEALLASIRAPFVLVDNTYREFMWGEPAYGANAWHAYSAACRPGTEVLALHSLTKFFDCAGIRLGYAAGAPSLLSQLAAHRAPWMVTTYAERMGARLLADIDSYRARLPLLRSNRQAMRLALQDTGAFSVHGVHEGPSFLCCRLRSGLSASTVREHLLKHRCIIRVCDNITGMPPGYIRIQARNPQDIPQLFTGLRSL